MGKYEEQAVIMVEAIERFGKDPEALANFESYLSHNFNTWLEKFASTPEGMAYEFRCFSRMFDGV